MYTEEDFAILVEQLCKKVDVDPSKSSTFCELWDRVIEKIPDGMISSLNVRLDGERYDDALDYMLVSIQKRSSASTLPDRLSE